MSSIQPLIKVRGVGVGGPPDGDWASVVSLLRFNGVNGGTVFTDERGKTWTRNGTGTVTTSAQFKFGTAALDLRAAANDNLQTTSSLADFNFPGQFCVDFWARFPTAPTAGVLFSAEGSDGLALKVNGSGGLTASRFGVVDIASSSGVTLAANTWHHIAISRDASDNLRMFVDGVVRFGPSPYAFTFTTPSVFSIGGYSNGTAENSAFFVDDFRVTKGAARYTSGFTPPTFEASNY